LGHVFDLFYRSPRVLGVQLLYQSVAKGEGLEGDCEEGLDVHLVFVVRENAEESEHVSFEYFFLVQLQDCEGEPEDSLAPLDEVNIPYSVDKLLWEVCREQSQEPLLSVDLRDVILFLQLIIDSWQILLH